MLCHAQMECGRAAAIPPPQGEGGARSAPGGVNIAIGAVPTRLALGFASARATLPEGGEGSWSSRHAETRFRFIRSSSFSQRYAAPI